MNAVEHELDMVDSVATMTEDPVIQTTLSRPQHITSLATAGSLFRVDISVYTGTKQNREISDEVTSAKKAKHDAGRWVQNLFASVPELKAVLNYRQTVYNWLVKNSYPWDGSYVYVPSMNIPKFVQEYREHETKYHDLVEKFLAAVPVAISNAAFVQGDMFKRADYPTVDQIRNKFRISLYTSEVPTNDFRTQLADDLADDLHRNYSRQTQEIIQGILNKQVRQLVTVMESLSHCCTVETVTDENGVQKTKKKKIYDSTVERALELCEQYKGFNLTNNPDLDAAARALAQTLSNVTTVAALRESDTLREQVKEEVDDILSKFRPRVMVDDSDDEVVAE